MMKWAPPLTPGHRLEELAKRFERLADRLDNVREELTKQASPDRFDDKAGGDKSKENWSGKRADRFRVHVGPKHRLLHLDQARDRFATAALLARTAAKDNDDMLVKLYQWEREVRDWLGKNGDNTDLPPHGSPDWQKWHRMHQQSLAGAAT